MSANTQPRFDRALRPEQNAVIARLKHGFAAHLQSEPLSVTRWLMYGQARLYVKTQQGIPIGWVDVRTGERMVEVPELQGAFEAAIAAIQPNIPPAYTPRRAVLESVVSTRRLKAESPAPCRAVEEVDQPTWSPVDRPAVTSRRKSPRSAGTPASRAGLVMPDAGPSGSTEPTEWRPEPFRLTRLEALSDQVRLWRCSCERELVSAELNTISRGATPWRYLRANDLGADSTEVDFLVAGPGGIFTIDVITPRTPSIPGLAFTKRTTEVLSRAMESAVWVRHLLVPVGFSRAQAAQLPGILPLVSRRQLPDFLNNQPEMLPAQDVELALGYARLRWTWRD